MRKHINNTVLLLLLLFVHLSANAQAPHEVQAKIKIDQSDNLVRIYATATNYSNTFKSDLKYNLFALKKNASGNLSKNNQTGTFSLEPKASKILSQQQLNIEPKGSINIYLFIYKNKKVIAKDTLAVGLIQKKYKNDAVAETQLEISGLILENVMTRPGRDFYDIFTQLARTNSTQYPFVILIDEKPKIGGRNSEIKIFAEDKLVFAFTTQPKEEVLQQAAHYANKKIYEYYLKRKSLYKNEKLY